MSKGGEVALKEGDGPSVVGPLEEEQRGGGLGSFFRGGVGALVAGGEDMALVAIPSVMID